MAMKYGFFNGVEQSDGNYDRTYDAEFFTRLIAAAFYTGVPSDAFIVTASSGLALNVSSGYGFIGGAFFYDDDATVLTCSSASSVRTDLVVVRYNAAARTVELAISQGAENAEFNEIALAQVTVSGSAITSITNLHSYYNYGAICGYADNAATLDGRSVYVQSTQPTSPSAGDLWFW